MFRSLLLFVTLLFTVTVVVTSSIIPRSAANSSHHADGNPRIAVFISVPLQGHLNPLISIANELSSRGWISYIASPSSIREAVTPRMSHDKGVDVRWMDIGECGGKEREEEFKRISHQGTNTTDETEGFYNIFVWFSKFHECAYPGTINAIKQLPYPPSVAIVDFGTTFGFAVADTLKIPMIVNNADLLAMISTDIVLASDYIPLMSLSSTSINDVGLAVAQRVFNPMIRGLFRWIIHFQQGAVLNEYRATVGLPPVSLFSWLRYNIIFVNTMFGLEYPRPIPPNVVLTGPMMQPTERGQQQADSLSAAELAWIESDPRPIVWVSMGTLAPLHYWQVQELAKGLSSFEFRVIWKLRKQEQQFLPSNLPDTIKITTWIQSQLGILKHTQTKVFISHCGINSVHEAAFYMVNLLCIPMFGDQPDQGLRIVDAGIGLTASKLNFTGAEITHKLLTMIQDVNGTYQHNAQRMRSAIKLAGGVQRAADIAQDVAQFGFAAYLPADVSYPWWARYQWDVWCIHLFMFWVLYRILRSCCRCGKKCTNSRPTRDHNHNNKQKRQ